MTSPVRGDASATAALDPVDLEPASEAVGPIPCLYCHEPIPSDDFAYWPGNKRLVSATCPSCRRRVALASVTWGSWAAERNAPGEASDSVELPAQRELG